MVKREGKASPLCRPPSPSGIATSSPEPPVGILWDEMERLINLKCELPHIGRNLPSPFSSAPKPSAPLQTEALTDEEEPMLNHALRFATIVAVALSITAPAFALCNPGTKNCIPDGGPGSRLAQAKNQVFTQPTSGQCDPGPAGICNDNLPGSARTAPKTGFHPITSTTPIVVK